MNIGIVATASYIPDLRLPLTVWSALASNAHPLPPDNHEALMQSVYADTIRWRKTSTAAALADAQDLSGLPDEGDIYTVAVEEKLMLSDMALHVVRTLLVAADRPGANAIGQIIVCQSSFEHDLTLSCASRLHGEVGQGKVPFAIGQLQGTSFLMALKLAAALTSGEAQPLTVLIVAAERWREPFARTVGTLTALGDGAAAALVQAGAQTGWIVLGVTVRTPADSQPADHPLAWIDTDALVSVVHETCDLAGVSPAAIDWVLPAHLNRALARDISVLCGMSSARTVLDDMSGTGYLCSADTPARLDRLLHAVKPHLGQYILVWSAGFQGQSACALLKFCGGEHVRA